MSKQLFSILCMLICTFITSAYALKCPKVVGSDTLQHPAPGQSWQLDSVDKVLWGVMDNPVTVTDQAIPPNASLFFIFLEVGENGSNKFRAICRYNLGTDLAPVIISLSSKNLYTAPTNQNFIKLGNNFKCTTVAGTPEKCESPSNPLPK